MSIFRFGRDRDPALGAHSRQLAGRVRELLALGEEDAVTVNQIDCGDAACEGGAETFILVMRAGQRTRAAKVSKSMALVSEADISTALESLR